MLTLDRRTCQLADDYSGKTLERDGEALRTITVQLDKIALDERELNALLGEPHAWHSLYDVSADRVAPFLRCLKALEFDKALEGVYVALSFGLDAREMKFTDCKLTKLKLELHEGGITAMSCKVTLTPFDDTLAELYQHFGTSVECEIRADVPTAQQDLPLNTHGVGEQPAARKKPFHTMDFAGGKKLASKVTKVVPTPVKPKRGRRPKNGSERTVQ